MNIITISREFGSGGREIGKKIAEFLGYDYYDKEIITEIASRHSVSEEYVEQTLLSSNVIPSHVFFHHSFTSPLYVNYQHSSILLEQRKIIEEIAAKGKDFVIIGRNSDVLLRDFSPFNIFITANLQDKIARCRLYEKENGENLSDKELKKKITKIDKARKRARYLITEKDWGSKDTYNLIVNSSGWDLTSLSSVLAQTALQYFKGRQD